MELREASVPFRYADAPQVLQAVKAPPSIRVGFVSEHTELKKAMKRVLELVHITLTQVVSTELIERAVERGCIDLAIVDIERQDEWPNSVFSRFDELAAHFPVILLCKRSQDIPHYIQKAKHLIFIFSHDTINDSRFPDVIQAMQLRAEVVKGDEADRSWGNLDDWLPPAA